MIFSHIIYFFLKRKYKKENKRKYKIKLYKTNMIILYINGRTKISIY